MKKLFSALFTLIAFTMITVFCFAGCSSTSKQDWVEVKKITYFINSFNDTYVSNEAEISATKDHPLKIRFLENNCIEINYKNETRRILPLSYEIIY